MSKLFKKKSVTQLLDPSKSKTLMKTLGSFDLVMLGLGSIIGTGVLVLAGLVAARDAGPAVVFFIRIGSNCMWIYSFYVTQKLLLYFRFQEVYIRMPMQQLVN